jgi:hypothetical protein
MKKNDWLKSKHFVIGIHSTAFAHRCVGQDWMIFLGKEGRPVVLGSGKTQELAWVGAEQGLRERLNMW